MEGDARRWWCPACMRSHGAIEVAPFERNGVTFYTCRDSGAIVQDALAAPPAPTGATSDDEERYWCPACMRSHTASEVAPFGRGSDQGLACRLTGAVVEPLVADAQATAAAPERPAAVGIPPVGSRSTANDPNLQTADEMARPAATSSSSSAATTPVSLDRPADAIDRG